MKLSVDWTLENRPRPIDIRVTAEIVRRTYPRSHAVDIWADDFSAVDSCGRPVALTPEEEREAETALLQRAELVEWCEACGRDRAVSLALCDECWLPKRRRA